MWASLQGTRRQLIVHAKRVANDGILTIVLVCLSFRLFKSFLKAVGVLKFLKCVLEIKIQRDSIVKINACFTHNKSSRELQKRNPNRLHNIK